MARIMTNPKQTQQKAWYADQNKVKVLFDKDNGYAFSDDSAMDETIAHFKSLGFVVKGEKSTLSDSKTVEKKETKKVSKE